MKYLKISTILIVLFLSCQNEKETDSIIQPTAVDQIFQKNENFFNSLNELSAIENKKEINARLEVILSDYNKKQSDLKFKTESLNEVQNEILKQYFIDLETKENITQFTNIYIQQIQNKNISESDKLFCINAIDFYQKLMNYVNLGDESYEAKDWEDCAHRGCMNCCMYRKAQDLADSNWVDKAFFLVSAAQTTSKWFGSCLWDCI
ncbi:hypothetical protein [Tenacibaculum aiptasiae]|uniref:hypothetical protein n=1 Tax=Tenacibaculum aiptasiae TaxID=426481 RepID=UPI003B590FE9